VEFSAADGGVEIRTRACRGKFRRAEARRAIAAFPRCASPNLPWKPACPPGVFNVVPGFGESAGQALGAGTWMWMRSLSTGSTDVGKLFLNIPPSRI